MTLLNNSLSAKTFVKFGEKNYLNDFNLILKLSIYAHSLMLNELSNKDKIEEEILRNKLLKYLKPNQGKYGLARYVFDAESAEIDENSDITVGYHDIKITIPIACDFSLEEQRHYTIECKRLDGYSDKNRSYIEEGIFRFIKGKYSSKMNIAGMIGFVEPSKKQFKTDKITSIIKDINEKLEKNFNRIDEMLEKSVIIEDFSNSYKSLHKRDKNLGTIDITHLIFDNTL